MDWDEALPKQTPQAALGDNLAALPVGELEARITAFECEIERVHAELIKKRAHEAAASALFNREARIAASRSNCIDIETRAAAPGLSIHFKQ